MLCRKLPRSPFRNALFGIPRIFAIGAFVGALMSLDACSNAPQSASPALDEQTQGPDDPLEKANRVIWAVDLKLNDYVLTPVARKYRDNVPEPVRHAVTNVLHNLESPVILLNDGLQGNGARAGDTFARLWLNTILGLGGLIDVGTASNIPFHEADFGETLGVWGVGPGPYLVLPLLGPSDPRDLVGKAADSEADPFGYSLRGTGISTQADLSREAVDVVNSQSQRIDDMAELRRSSLDFYAAVRSLYQQDRAGAVRDAKMHSAFGQTSSLSMPPPADQQAALPADTLAPAGAAMAPSESVVPADLSFLPPAVTNQRHARSPVTTIGH